VSSSDSRLDALKAKLAATPALRASGRVIAVTGLSLRFSMPGVRVGDVVRVLRRGDPLACEVVGFDRGEALGMPLGALVGVGPDDEVEATGGGFLVRASDSLLGRVVDGLGRPLDGRGAIEGDAVAMLQQIVS
jgi:flagellum-specific ATP synthase